MLGGELSKRNESIPDGPLEKAEGISGAEEP